MLGIMDISSDGFIELGSSSYPNENFFMYSRLSPFTTSSIRLRGTEGASVSGQDILQRLGCHRVRFWLARTRNVAFCFSITFSPTPGTAPTT